MPLRFRDIKAAAAKEALYCETDSRLFDIVNEAQETLLNKGKWKGTILTFNFCVNSNACVVWPREIEAIEAIAVCKSPVTIRSQWYEFAASGFGLIDAADNCFNQLVDRGEVVAFDEVVGSNKKLAVYADRTEGTGKYITLQFYDSNGQWVRSTFNGEVIDGEKLAIPSAAGQYTYSSAVVKPGGLWRVMKDVTLGVIRLYSYDTTNGALKPLAYYQPDEILPSYRSSLIPAVNNGGCEQKQVTVRAKVRFIPARTDDDWLMIDSMRAIRLGVRAIKKELDGQFQEAAVFMGMAVNALQEQLKHHQGDGEQVTVNFVSPRIWGGGETSCIR